jgi:hypothetical protein
MMGVYCRLRKSLLPKVTLKADLSQYPLHYPDRPVTGAADIGSRSTSSGNRRFDSEQIWNERLLH